MPELTHATTSRFAISQPPGPLGIAAAEDGRIAAIEPITPPDADTVTTLGLVDLQVNGFGGIDFNDEKLTAEAFDRALAAMLATGVTRCLPTIITAQQDRLSARLTALDSAIRGSRLGPLMVGGIHLEGPFLSPEDGYAGCHPKDAMRPPSLEVYDDLTQGLATPVVLTTIAPEWQGSADFIRALTARGTVVSLGHTRASRADIQEAVKAGARMSTHLGNGVAHMLKKNDNPLFAQLAEDGLIAGLIADGIHIPPYMLQSWIRAKQTGRAALVTDATAAAAAPPGPYTLGDVAVERGDDGVVRERGSPYLAGSSVTLDQCLRNVMAWFGYDFDTALAMARTTPLSAIGKSTTPAVGDVAEYVRWSRQDGEWFVAEARVGAWQVRPTS